METRNPTEGYFGSKFPAICNCCVVMASTLKISEYSTCLRFFKTTPYGKFFVILFLEFLSRHRSTFCAKMSWNLADWKWVKSCYAFLPDKICQGQPPIMYSDWSRFHPNRFTFGGVIAERVNTAKMRRKVNPIFGWNLASSRITSDLIYSFLMLQVGLAEEAI